MAKFSAVIVMIVLLGVFGFLQFKSQAGTERDAINQAIAKSKVERELRPEEEVLLRVQLALVDYLAKKGNPPVTLQEMVPTYFDTVPVDPSTGREIAYVREGRAYRLGMQVELAKDTPLSETIEPQSKSGATGKKAVGSLALLAREDAEFVNPNTLVEDSFVYDPSGRRDPFRPFDFSGGPRDPSLSPLEQLDLGELRVTAILAKADGTKTAAMEDATGRGYNVTVGTKVGRNGGEVVEITDDTIKILESSVDIAGRIQQVIQEKKIQASNETITKSKVKKGGSSFATPKIPSFSLGKKK